MARNRHEDGLNDDDLPEGLRGLLASDSQTGDDDFPEPELDDDAIDDDDDSSYDTGTDDVEEQPAHAAQAPPPAQEGASAGWYEAELARRDRANQGLMKDLAAARERSRVAEMNQRAILEEFRRRTQPQGEEQEQEEDIDPREDPAGAILQDNRRMFGAMSERLERFEQAEEQRRVEAQHVSEVNAASDAFAEAANNGLEDVPQATHYLLEWTVNELVGNGNDPNEAAKAALFWVTDLARKALYRGVNPAVEIYRAAQSRGYGRAAQPTPPAQPPSRPRRQTALDRRMQAASPAPGGPAPPPQGAGVITREFLESLNDEEFARLDEGLEREGRSIDQVMAQLYSNPG